MSWWFVPGPLTPVDALQPGEVIFDRGRRGVVARVLSMRLCHVVVLADGRRIRGRRDRQHRFTVWKTS